MNRCIIALLLICGVVLPSLSQELPVADKDVSSIDWGKVATDTYHSMITHFWGASFNGAEGQKYFNARGNQASMRNEWWWQAHAMDVVVDEYMRTGDSACFQLYEPWYEGIQSANYETFDDDPLHNHSIDDMEWICITLIRMYESCGDVRYFNHARGLYDNYIITTWGPEDEAPWYGGISWSTKPSIKKTKNACSNGPGGIIAYMLARNLQGEERAKYIDDLKRIYSWERKYLFDEETGSVFDHISQKGIWHRCFSYNIGTFVAMAREMYEQTGDTLYLNDAIKASDYTIKHFAHGDSQLMTLISKHAWGGDHGLFHGIFFRYFSELIRSHILPRDKEIVYADYLKRCGISAVNNLVDGVDLFSNDWEHVRINTPSAASLTPHVTGATLLQMLAR